MNANEFRIGNFVSFNQFYRHIIAIEKNTVCISINKDEDEDEDLVMKIFIDADYGIEPIPLTAEILERCGFEIKGDWFHIYFKNTDRKFGLMCSFASEDFEYMNLKKNELMHLHIIQWQQAGIKPPVKYLHQLQNLYFALTGTELTVKL